MPYFSLEIVVTMCEHHGHCEHIQAAEDTAHLYNLYKYIDMENLVCLNERVADSGKKVFKPFEERKDSNTFVESDVDEELLFNIPFTGSVKLKGIIIAAENGETHPASVAIFKNRFYMTFDDANAAPDQCLELHEDPNGEITYPLKVMKFGSVQHLSLHFKTNFGVMEDLFEQFLKDIGRDIDRFERAYPGLPSQSSQKQQRVNELWVKLHEIYNRQECFRRSYNEIVKQLTTISFGLPDWVFSYETPEYLYGQEVDVYQGENETEDEEIEPLSADFLNFMLKTYRHQEQRDKAKAKAEAVLMKFPPLVDTSNNLEPNSLAAKRLQLETKIANFYENSSDCLDMPFWPIIPLRKLNR
ncbi:unnamed protein product [Hymenolepis diminuta]|uniref:PITH domain-containing protein n=2 Tax=Hymenolepis diminuta TaxID=6216 RepID=A0A3P6WLL2_HYMDI|nr:unnamed protein product [Hymenolepis diminuta]